MLIGIGGRALIQAAYFVGVARGLGADGYGVFAAVVALVAVLAPFTGLGVGFVLIQRVSEESETVPRLWATAKHATWISGVVLGAAVVATADWLAPHAAALLVVACIAGADLVFAALSNLASQAFVALNRVKVAARFYIAQNLLRAVGAAVLLLIPGHEGPLAWSFAYLIASVPPSLWMLRLATRAIGRGRPDLGLIRTEWRHGAFYSFGLAAQSVYNDIDKAMLGRLSTSTATAIYTAAYRVVDLAFTPIRAINGAAIPKYYRAGVHGLNGTVVVARRIAPACVGLGLLGAAVLFAGADLVPVVLGDEYRASVGALRGLAVLLVIKAVHYLAADVLTGARRQPARTAVQATVAALNVGLNVWLIPRYGWQGAVVTSLISDGLLAITLWLLVWKLRQRSFA